MTEWKGQPYLIRPTKHRSTVTGETRWTVEFSFSVFGVPADWISLDGHFKSRDEAIAAGQEACEQDTTNPVYIEAVW